MNHSMHFADHRTHIKIVVLGLICAMLVAAVGTFGHVATIDLGTEPLVKAASKTVLSGNLAAIR
jgi:hypothetical protein